MSRPAVVRIYASELNVLLDEMHSHPMIETGGDLFGLWSHGDMPTIFLASRPGPAAVRETMTFQQDVRSHRRVEKGLWERFGVQCVGMWHSHHRLGMDILSRGDLGRTMRYARRSHRERFVDLLGFYEDIWCVRPFLYRDAAIGRTRATKLEVLPGVSPLRLALDSSDEALAGAVFGPPVPHLLLPSEPQTPRRAPKEGETDVDPASLAPAEGKGRGPWRAVDAVERLVGSIVPAPLMEGLELSVLDDHQLALQVPHRSGRTLVALLDFDGGLRVSAWEVVGDRPVVGAPSGDVAATLKSAVSALEHG